MTDSPETISSSTELAGKRTEMADSRTDLAFDRSQLASDRTTMAYMRTAVSLIGFGFTIFKFFQYLADTDAFADLPNTGARRVGMAFLVLGVSMLFLAVVQQGLYLKRLSREHAKSFPLSIALVSCIAMLGIGLAALFNMVTVSSLP